MAPGARPRALTFPERKVVRFTFSKGGKVLLWPEMLEKPWPRPRPVPGRGHDPGLPLPGFSQVRPKGEVLTQNPSSGAVGGRGQMVDLTVSKGPPPEGTLLMPDFVDRPLAMATQWANDSGIQLSTSEEKRDDLAPGVVLKQEPAPDAILKSGQKVSLTVSSSPSGAAANVRWVRYQVPFGEDSPKVKVVLRDEKGEKIVFDGTRPAGALVEAAVTPRGPARVRIYLGGVLVDERVLE